MTCLDTLQSTKSLTLMSFAWIAIHLMASTPTPALAGSSGTWTATGGLNVARIGHTTSRKTNRATSHAPGVCESVFQPGSTQTKKERFTCVTRFVHAGFYCCP